ncbi:kielin/chordin-like protein, partial [Saccostrea cucullata]|uniref:kielin/chordin-like protein n=1 Tax=Saccostrea cuccullata TaxID=36930 RepID=UPI002ED3054D
LECNYKGREYNNGEIFKDGCQSCKCSNGQVSCREERCAYCYYNGKKYQEGENFPATDGCNTCTCGGNGSVGCTKIGCPKFCFYNGQKYSVGQKFPATDGCNTCTCESTGGISCTEMACNPGGYTG